MPPMSSSVVDVDVTQNHKKYISFSLGEMPFCIDVMTVREITGWIEPSLLPHAPDYVCGVISLRGIVLPIIDFAHRLGVATDPTTQDTGVIIILETGAQPYGIKVDGVSDILMVDRTQMQAVPEHMSCDANAFLEGILVFEDQMVRVIDAERVFPDRDAPTFSNLETPDALAAS